MVSRMCLIPQIQATTRSTPRPNPEWGTGAVFSQVDVPLIGFGRKLVFLDPLFEKVEVMDALAAADDFAVAFGGEKIDAQGQVRPFGVRLHVEGLDLGREMGDADRARSRARR